MSDIKIRSARPDNTPTACSSSADVCASDQRSSAAGNKPGSVPFAGLDDLWFQVSGTICNLTCSHCFISCSPDNHSFEFMSRETVSKYLSEAQRLGVKEFYFTGGEPFLNKEIYGMLEDTLAVGTTSVLTNGTVIRQRVAEKLKNINDRSAHTLELRVSLDGYDAETNDRFRGKGSFESALKGVKALVEAGFRPIITAVQTWTAGEQERVYDSFVAVLEEIGYANPRIKILPALDLGEHKQNRSDVVKDMMVTERMLENYDTKRLLCSNSRMATNRGVYVCPILIDSPEARMGESIEETMITYSLQQKACYTCYQHGAICSNSGTVGKVKAVAPSGET